MVYGLSEEKEQSFVELTIPEPNFDLPPRKYFGRIGKDSKGDIEVYAFRDKLVLSRTYAKKIRLSWRFNRGGRITKVDTTTFPNNVLGKLVIISDKKRDDPNFLEIRALTGSFPPNIYLVNKDEPYGCVKNQQDLFNLGHGTAQELIYAVARKNIGDSQYRKEDQIDLTKILNDGAALTILETASRLRPTVTETNGTITIKYPPNSDSLV